MSCHTVAGQAGCTGCVLPGGQAKGWRYLGSVSYLHEVLLRFVASGTHASMGLTVGHTGVLMGVVPVGHTGVHGV